MMLVMSTLLEVARRMIAGEGPPAPIASLLGFTLTAIEPGRARIELAADHRHANPMGTPHGGVLCDIADAAMGMAYAATLEEGETFTTLELKIQYQRAITLETGRVRAEGKLVTLGRRVAFAEGRLVDLSGRLHASATSTLLVFAR